MNRGIAAIITVIILGSLMTMIGTVMILSSISKGQIILLDSQVKKNQNLLDACAEESLIKINRDNALPATISTTLGSCNLTLNSQVGTSWNFNIGTTGAMSPLNINVVLNRGSTISISSWLDQ
ncbi:MAG: hypothetical protein WCG91_00045 [Candidatus Shapirobacteria bacterium]